MKYNPKINEKLSQHADFLNLHPELQEKYCQNILHLIYELQNDLSEITGMDNFSTIPSAGAQGEYLGLYIIKEYLNDNNKGYKNIILVPDSAHGTNPASASMTGFKIKTISSNKDGLINITDLKNKLNENVAGLMMTNPNTLGLFEKDILNIAELVHKSGGLLYYDGANMNAIMGFAKPGLMNFDVMHLNLHKTFSTPHGGGGPGSGPVGVKKHLEKYLPSPKIIYENCMYKLTYPNDIYIHSFLGNIQVLVKTYIYIKLLGGKGLKNVSEFAVLNANYMKKLLTGILNIPYNNICKHEFVASAKELKNKYNIKALDIAKGLINEKVYAPTVYFPLIVSEALMFEPTETESLDSINNYCSLIIDIIEKFKTNPELLNEIPNHLPVLKIDEVTAAKKIKVKEI